MSMSMIMRQRNEVRVRALTLSVRGEPLCLTCLEHGRESVLLAVRSRRRLWLICLAPGCSDGLSRDEVMTRPVRGCKGWTDKVLIVVSKKLLPPAVAAEFCDKISQNGRVLQWAVELLKGLAPPPVQSRPKVAKERTTMSIRGGKRPRKEKHRHKNHR